MLIPLSCFVKVKQVSIIDSQENLWHESSLMDQEQKNTEFRKIADSFIDLANSHCDSMDSNRVGSALLYATARFSAFVVASHASGKSHYESEIDHALDFFTQEFRRMLNENLEQYKSAFKDESKQAQKYQHLMKKQNHDSADD